MAVAISVVVVASLLVSCHGCEFPAIYNFGDSNSDTGSMSAAFDRVLPPYGQTFFGRPSGRKSDGRLIIDFIADELKLPFLSAYLDAIDSNFSHGANFAATSATIQPIDVALFDAGFSPLSLDVQLLQFQQLKERTNELCQEAKDPNLTDRLPRLEEFSKALYILDIGQNDLSHGLRTTTVELVKESIPHIISQFAVAIQKLYDGGARIFWIHNTGPIGCLPYTVIKYPPKHEKADPVTGCIKSYNEVAQEFNKQLKDRISQLRAKLLGAKLIYVDIYTAKYSLITEANKHGFVGPPIYCCGWHLGSYIVFCGRTGVVNGTEIYGASCGEPGKYISWDGIHYTEAANQWVANRFFDGSFSDPPIPIRKACLPSFLFSEKLNIM